MSIFISWILITAIQFVLIYGLVFAVEQRNNGSSGEEYTHGRNFALYIATVFSWIPVLGILYILHRLEWGKCGIKL